MATYTRILDVKPFINHFITWKLGHIFELKYLLLTHFFFAKCSLSSSLTSEKRKLRTWIQERSSVLSYGCLVSNTVHNYFQWEIAKKKSLNQKSKLIQSSLSTSSDSSRFRSLNLQNIEKVLALKAYGTLSRFHEFMLYPNWGIQQFFTQFFFLLQNSYLKVVPNTLNSVLGTGKTFIISLGWYQNNPFWVNCQ